MALPYPTQGKAGGLCGRTLLLASALEPDTSLVTLFGLRSYACA